LNFPKLILFAIGQAEVTTPAPQKGQASTVLIPTDCSPNLSILIAAFQSRSTESPQ